MTRLIEFKNRNGETLRGLFDKAGSRSGVIFMHGFEETTVDAKFKNAVDALRGEVNLFRFDFSGCGLSDGKFESLTVGKRAGELASAVAAFSGACPKLGTINLAAHSLGCCVVLKHLETGSRRIKRAALMSPALKQGELFRYWFTRSRMRHADKSIRVGWDNFRDHFSEEEYRADLKIEKRMTNEHWLRNYYFLENEKADYMESLAKIGFNYGNLLVIHGDNDEVVPPQSNRWPDGVRVLMVKNGDHNLRKPDMVRQYLKKLADFLRR